MHIVSVIVEFAIILGFLVLVHEFGHFAVAKLCGVRVEVFSIGFGPRIVGYKHGDTDYRISILPLGGYVKMAGEYGGTAEASGAPDEFPSKTRGQRVLIGLAGPVANFILSFVLVALVAHYHHQVDKYLNGPAVVDYVPLSTPAAQDGLAPGDTITAFNGKVNPDWNQIFDECELNLSHAVSMSYTHNGQTITRDINILPGDTNSPLGPDPLLATGLLPRKQDGAIVIASIAGGTPAESAGLKPGDHIERVDSLTLHSVDPLHAYLKDRAGAPSTLQVLRDGRQMTFTLAPQHVSGAPSYADYQIGFLPVPLPVDIVHLPLGQSIKESITENLDNSTLVLRLVKGMFTRHVSVKSLSGPVGIAQQIDIATQMGIWTLLGMVSTISLQLGIFNLLPIPILDGGMILFLLIESVMRRDVNERFKEYVYQVAFVCLILFAVFVLFNDITRLHLGH